MTNVSGSVFSDIRDVLLFGCVVIPQGSGTAKYNDCSLVPHSELMKSGPAQEERGIHTEQGVVALTALFRL